MAPKKDDAGNGNRPPGATPIVTTAEEEIVERQPTDEFYDPPSAHADEEKIDFSQPPHISLPQIKPPPREDFYINATTSGSLFRNEGLVQRYKDLSDRASSDRLLTKAQRKRVTARLDENADAEGGKPPSYHVVVGGYLLGIGALLNGIAAFVGLLASHPGWGLMTLPIVAGGGFAAFRKWGHLLRQEKSL